LLEDNPWAQQHAEIIINPDSDISMTDADTNETNTSNTTHNLNQTLDFDHNNTQQPSLQTTSYNPFQ
jgi:hypothetical protein